MRELTPFESRLLAWAKSAPDHLDMTVKKLRRHLKKTKSLDLFYEAFPIYDPDSEFYDASLVASDNSIPGEKMK